VNLSKFIKEVLNAPYYRTRPHEVIRYAYAKWVYQKHRIEDPLDFLQQLGIDPKIAMDGYSRWRPMLEDACQKIKDRSGLQGGISMEDGTVLYGITRAIRPRNIIETGVAAGMSTSFISAALLENGTGHLTSIELPVDQAQAGQWDGCHFAWPELGVGWAIPQSIKEGIAQRHTLVPEDVCTALPRILSGMASLDFFFHDDLHVPSHMRWEYDLVYPKLSPGGFILSDDADYGWVGFCRSQGLPDSSFNNIQRLTAAQKPVASRPAA
jgi:hypothetical protein